MDKPLDSYAVLRSLDSKACDPALLTAAAFWRARQAHGWRCCVYTAQHRFVSLFARLAIDHAKTLGLTETIDWGATPFRYPETLLTDVWDACVRRGLVSYTPPSPA